MKVVNLKFGMKLFSSNSGDEVNLHRAGDLNRAWYLSSTIGDETHCDSCKVRHRGRNN